LLEPLLRRVWWRRGYPSLAFGKFAEAEDDYREVEGWGAEPLRVNPLVARTWLHTLPFIPVENRLPGLYDVDELDEWLSSGTQNSDYLPATYWQGLYVKGLLIAMRGGQPGTVMEIIRELESYAGADTLRIAARFALGLRAQLHWQRGQLEEALATIESMPELRREGSGMHWPMAGGWREIYLRAEILRLLGRLDEAEAWFQHSVGYRFPAESFLKRGEIAEARGDTEAAIEWYRKFVMLWEDADDWLQPRVNEVRTRIERLEAGA
jgi:tetratricopeptide (TPR) repeat protein